MKETSCRSCGTTRLEPVLSLGEMPLVNALARQGDLPGAQARYPLDLVMCPECSLTQISETVPPEILFREYAYFSSYSESFLRHVQALADRVVRERQLTSKDLVVEIASNDGYLLQYYHARGIPVLGIEPAANVAAVACRERSIPTLAEFFGRDLARRLREEGRRAAVLHAHNVLAHVADLNGFVAGMQELLADDGVAVVEVPYLLDMIDRCEFDTIYHEHLCYFSVTALHMLLTRHGLQLQDVERVPVHGGSLRLWIGRGAPAPTVEQAMEVERLWGVKERAPYVRFAQRVATVQRELRELLCGLHARGKTIAAYGAAAKGAVLLNSIALEPGIISFVVDRSPHKQGCLMPGVRLPILAPQALVDSRPDYLLVLAWNLVDEIVAQQEAYRRKGGHFIVPIPEPRVL